MLETKQEALDRGVATMRKNYEAQVAKGKLAQAKYEERMALLSTTLNYSDLGNSDLVIEAVFEELEVKKAVFEQLRRDETGCHLGIQHVDPGRQQDRALHQTPAGCRGDAFLQPRKRHEAPRSRSRRRYG
jgi:hypothetical protein